MLIRATCTQCLKLVRYEVENKVDGLGCSQIPSDAMAVSGGGKSLTPPTSVTMIVSWKHDVVSNLNNQNSITRTICVNHEQSRTEPTHLQGKHCSSSYFLEEKFNCPKAKAYSPKMFFFFFTILVEAEVAEHEDVLVGYTVLKLRGNAHMSESKCVYYG